MVNSDLFFRISNCCWGIAAMHVSNEKNFYKLQAIQHSPNVSLQSNSFQLIIWYHLINMFKFISLQLQIKTQNYYLFIKAADWLRARVVPTCVYVVYEQHGKVKFPISFSSCPTSNVYLYPFSIQFLQDQTW